MAIRLETSAQILPIILKLWDNEEELVKAWACELKSNFDDALFSYDNFFSYFSNILWPDQNSVLYAMGPFKTRQVKNWVAFFFGWIAYTTRGMGRSEPSPTFRQIQFF